MIQSVQMERQNMEIKSVKISLYKNVLEVLDVEYTSLKKKLSEASEDLELRENFEYVKKRREATKAKLDKLIEE
jgi:hypothetical protein